METIDTGVFLKLIENLEYDDVKKLCSTSSKFRNLCIKHHDVLWNHKIMHDFNFSYDWRSIDIDPEEAYRDLITLKIGYPNYDNLNTETLLVYYNNLPGLIYYSSTNPLLNIDFNYVIEAVRDNNLNIVKYLTDNKLIDIHFNDDEIMEGVNNKENLNFLTINYNVNPHAHDDIIMSNVASTGNIKFFEELIEEGFNPNSNNDDPLTWALENDHLEMVYLLLNKYNADPNAQGLGQASSINLLLFFRGDYDLLMNFLNKGYYLTLPNMWIYTINKWDDKMLLYLLENNLKGNVSDILRHGTDNQKKITMRHIVNNVHDYIDFLNYLMDPEEFLEFIKTCIDCDKANSKIVIEKLRSRKNF